MNLLDIDVTPPATVFAAVEAEARRRGIGILKTEVVGLVPERAVIGAAAAWLKCPDVMDHLLEAKIRAREGEGGPGLDDWIQELAGPSPTPGGGSAAALAGALAAALVAMVCRLTSGRKAYAAVQGRVDAILKEAEAAQRMERALVDLDAAAYDLVRLAYLLPKDHPDRPAAVDDALLSAARTPLATARSAARLVPLAREISAIGNKNARSDAKVAEILARAAVLGAVENVRVNVAGVSQPTRGRDLPGEAERLEREGRSPS